MLERKTCEIWTSLRLQYSGGLALQATGSFILIKEIAAIGFIEELFFVAN